MPDRPPQSLPPVLALVKDLLFASKISATARSQDVSLRVLRDPSHLLNQPGRLLLVDLNQPDTIPAAAAWHHATGHPVVGFVSHVDTQTIARAREAGIPRVLARSAFVEQLPDLLALQSPAPP